MERNLYKSRTSAVVNELLKRSDRHENLNALQKIRELEDLFKKSDEKLADYRELLHDLSEVLKTRNEAIKEYDDMIKDLVAQNGEYIDIIENQEKEIANNEAPKLRKELQKLEAEVDKKTFINQDLERQLKNRNQMYDKACLTIQKLMVTIKNQQIENNRLKNSIQMSNDAKTPTEKEAEKLREELQKLKAEVADKTCVALDLEEKLKNCDLTIQTLMATIKNHQIENDRLKNSTQMLKVSSINSDEELTPAVGTSNTTLECTCSCRPLNGVEALNAVTCSQNYKYDNIIEQQKARIQNLKAEVKKEIANLQAENLREELHKLKAEVAEKTCIAQDLEEKLKNSDLTIQQLMATIKNQQIENDRLKNSTQMLNVSSINSDEELTPGVGTSNTILECTCSCRPLNDAEPLNAVTCSQNHKYDNIIEQQKVRIQNLEAEVKKEIANLQAENLREELQKLKAEVADKTCVALDLEEKLKNRDQQYDKALLTIQKLKATIKNQQIENNRLKNSIQMSNVSKTTTDEELIPGVEISNTTLKGTGVCRSFSDTEALNGLTCSQKHKYEKIIEHQKATTKILKAFKKETDDLENLVTKELCERDREIERLNKILNKSTLLSPSKSPLAAHNTSQGDNTTTTEELQRPVSDEEYNKALERNKFLQYKVDDLIQRLSLDAEPVDKCRSL